VGKRLIDQDLRVDVTQSSLERMFKGSDYFAKRVKAHEERLRDAVAEERPGCAGCEHMEITKHEHPPIYHRDQRVITIRAACKDRVVCKHDIPSPAFSRPAINPYRFLEPNDPRLTAAAPTMPSLTISTDEFDEKAMKEAFKGVLGSGIGSIVSMPPEPQLPPGVTLVKGARFYDANTGTEYTFLEGAWVITGAGLLSSAKKAETVEKSTTNDIPEGSDEQAW
jgi:hypothetical protein